MKWLFERHLDKTCANHWVSFIGKVIPSEQEISHCPLFVLSLKKMSTFIFQA